MNISVREAEMRRRKIGSRGRSEKGGEGSFLEEGREVFLDIFLH